MGLMFEGMWRACTNIRDGETDEHNLKCMDHDHPFVADAVIANPPSMAPPHIVERLGIPLFMAFTFPYTPTQQFPHPLANIRPGRSNVDTSYVNFMSYPLVEMMTWQGLGDVVNRFRVKTLRLEPVSALWAPGALYRMKVPYAYMWSPGLIPKPSDWGPEIDITGFVFLDLASNFKPPDDLAKFLDAGEPPVYIGFGSIVVDDPKAFTKMIFAAVKKAGVRALVNKGWGGLGDGDDVQVPENVFMLENTPHDWLFPKVAAVVHHGGAGTTAIGLKCGKPTMIVPFFGDQPFWGAEVAKHQAGALECIPYKKLTVERLAEGIKQCLTEEARVNAQRLAEDIIAEGDGAANAVASFHRSLPFSGPNSMRCSILEERVAVWQVKGTSLRLSALAAEILLQKGKIKRHDLKLLRHCSWNDFDGPGEPITGTVAAITDSVFDIGTGVGLLPLRVAKQVRKRQEHEQKKRKHAMKKAEHRRQKDAARAAHANAEIERENAEKKDIDAQSPSAEAKETPSRPSLQREHTASTEVSVISTDAPLPNAIATEFSTGLKKSVIALITMPNDLHLAIAQGFHNAPRLWGDATVRKPTRITGIKSGLVAARREFVYGVYDGFTGVVTQPIGGWRDAAAHRALPAVAEGESPDGKQQPPPPSAGLVRKLGGFGTGVAKGLGGLVVKNVSAIITPPAYFGKGVLVWSGKKMEGESTKKFLRRSHFTAGFVELLDLRNAAAADGEKWKDLQATLGRVAQKMRAVGVIGKWSEIEKEKKREREKEKEKEKAGGGGKEEGKPPLSSKEEAQRLGGSSPAPPPVRRETAPVTLGGGGGGGGSSSSPLVMAKKNLDSPLPPKDGDENSDLENTTPRTTADGSGIGGKGHLEPLVPPTSSPSSPDHDDDDDLPSDTTLASPGHHDDHDGKDDEEDKKSSKSSSSHKEKDSSSSPLVHYVTAPASTDSRDQHINVDSVALGKEKKGEESLLLAEGKGKDGKNMGNGSGKKSKLPSPRAMMKGTKFGRRPAGQAGRVEGV
jgi:UDP:flavonoid glycosyltransferase YjiC (YdhE family)